MTVTVGHDLSKTRKTLTAGGQTVSYYSIPAAEAAGLGNFAKLPASLIKGAEVMPTETKHGQPA